MSRYAQLKRLKIDVICEIYVPAFISVSKFMTHDILTNGYTGGNNNIESLL